MHGRFPPISSDRSERERDSHLPVITLPSFVGSVLLSRVLRSTSIFSDAVLPVCQTGVYTQRKILSRWLFFELESWFG